MHRFYLPPTECRQDTLRLVGPEAHHALRVLRLKAPDRVIVLDGAGHELLAEVVGAERRTLTLAVRQRTALPQLPGRLTLIQAVTKNRSMDLIVQKATELGAVRIVPVLSERSVPHFEKEDGEHKLERWRAIAIESIKQCGSPWLPCIDPPLKPAQFLARREAFALVFLASLQPGHRHPREYFRGCYGETHQLPRNLAVWVGPEGDFTPAELGAIRSSGALPITLGPLILRSETAAIYCLSVLSYELQGMSDGWRGEA
jgi:16S rRNA (uracil1498-N3)-methyltransferase